MVFSLKRIPYLSGNVRGDHNHHPPATRRRDLDGVVRRTRTDTVKEAEERLVPDWSKSLV
ncbi:hypothetical protein BQ8794_280045 [Mesorhizobium prunaredense]|uniref:Uncharacterized protein n=1 Tax=Mesorhizobium prunaredense TaxID=1631249 RepID=A0A1R3V8W3_9HYPH|nr:hypothetical protein BQ8794_280045 [Mesorhizobium prunaredense]